MAMAMAMAITLMAAIDGNCIFVLVPFPSRSCFFKFISTISIRPRTSASTIRASSASSMEASTPVIMSVLRPSTRDIKGMSHNLVMADKKFNNIESVLACSVCYGPLTAASSSALSVKSTNGYQLKCCTCKKSFTGNETYLDLTISSGTTTNNGQSMPVVSEIFRTRLVSFLYERGWRKGFSSLAGFPAQEKEFELIKDFMAPVLGGNIIDASCGSGIFARIFAKSGLFSSIVALDYSENMLKQCYDFIKQEEKFPNESLVLIRADIARLPFASSSIDAVHAGAALHCWPSPSAAVAAISRILRPGGVFVATTLILDGPFSFIPFFGTQMQIIKQITGSHVIRSEGELEELCRACGLVDFRCVRNRGFVMISAKKCS